MEEITAKELNALGHESSFATMQYQLTEPQKLPQKAGCDCEAPLVRTGCEHGHNRPHSMFEPSVAKVMLCCWPVLLQSGAVVKSRCICRMLPHASLWHLCCP